MKIAFFDYFNDHFPVWLPGFRTYLEGKGHNLDIRMVRTLIGDEELKKYDLIFVWNAELYPTNHIKKRSTKLGIPCYVVEVGWFPQKKNFFIDPDGINGHGSLINDDLSWITNEHIQKMRTVRNNYLNGRRWTKLNRYVLCPLQLEGDTNILHFSPFKKMQKFIDYVESLFSSNRIIFKIHPKDPNSYSSSHEIRKTGKFLDIAQNAECVFGINSTCLLESSLMGIPTTSIGVGYLGAHKGNEEKLFAALVDKQIPVGENNLDYWLDNLLALAAEGKMK